MPLSDYRAALATRPFRTLAVAMGVSDLGDGMSLVVIPLVAIGVAQGQDTALVVGGAVAAYALPGVLGVLLLGRWLRRLRATTVLIADSALRATMLAAVAVLWATGNLTPAGLIGLCAASSVLHAWGAAGKFSLIADDLPEDQRITGNALVTSVQSLSIIIGPSVAGLLAHALSLAWLVAFDALTFTLLGYVALRRHRRQQAPVPDKTAPGGWRSIRAQPALLGLLAMTWVFYALYGPIEVALPLHATGGNVEQAGVLGIYWTVFGIGAVVGGLGAGLVKESARWPAMLIIVALWGLALLPFGLGLPTAAEIACFALAGLVWGPFPAISLTVTQSLSPPGAITSVLAARTAILLTATPVGTALGGPLTEAAKDPTRVLVGSGLATLALAVVTAGAVVIIRRSSGSILR